jgi:hypothetical protein
MPSRGGVNIDRPRSAFQACDRGQFAATAGGEGEAEMNDTLKGAIALTIMTAVLLLAAGIYFFTLYLAYLTSFGSLLLTLFIPALGQLYWLWIVWGTTGVFFNWFTIACLVWLGLVALSLAILAKTRTDAQ